MVRVRGRARGRARVVYSKARYTAMNMDWGHAYEQEYSVTAMGA